MYVYITPDLAFSTCMRSKRNTLSTCRKKNSTSEENKVKRKKENGDCKTTENLTNSRICVLRLNFYNITLVRFPQQNFFFCTFFLSFWLSFFPVGSHTYKQNTMCRVRLFVLNPGANMLFIKSSFPNQ